MTRSAITLLLVTILLFWSNAVGAGPTTTKTQQPETEAPAEEEQTEETADEDETAASEDDGGEESEPSMAEKVAADDSMIMLDPASGEPSGSPSLVEAARAERERRQGAERPAIVITNKNLAEYATGDLTTSDAPETVDVEAAPGATAEETELAKDEAYWRRRAREIRIEWRQSVEAIPEAESRVAELRMAFYAEDDGFYRDQEIKPAWDKAIRDLDAARLRAEEMEEELDLFLEAGRQAGALPGWLREGIELEPEMDREQREIETFEPIEPVVIEEPQGGGEDGR